MPYLLDAHSFNVAILSYLFVVYWQGWDADFIFNPKSTQRSNQPLEINDVDDLDLEFEDDDRGGPLQAGGTGSHRASPLPPQTNKSLARTEGSKKNTSLQPQVSSLSESMEEVSD